MKTENIIVENLKCHGCANTVQKELNHMKGVENVQVSIDSSTVELSFDEKQTEKNDILRKLARLGYPEQGNNSFRSQAVSYVSCAVGRMSK